METKNWQIINKSKLDILKQYKEKIAMEKGSDCEEQENRLFNELDDRKRILMELRIIKKKLDENNRLYMLYIDYYNEALSKYSVIGLTKAVIPEIKRMIVQLDVACGLPVHLYSAIPSLIRTREEKHGKNR